MSVTFSVERISEFEIPQFLLLSPLFSTGLIRRKHRTIVQWFVVFITTVYDFFSPTHAPTLPEVWPTPEHLGTQNLQFWFPHSLTLPSNLPNLNANWTKTIKLLGVVLVQFLSVASCDNATMCRNLRRNVFFHQNGIQVSFFLRTWNQNFFRFHAGKFFSAAPILDCLILSFETRVLSFEMPNDLFIAYVQYCHAPKCAPVIPASNSFTPMGAECLFF